MISPSLEAQILRLHHGEGWPVGTIAHQLDIHHSVVQRVLGAAGVPKPLQSRPSIADPYMPFVLQTLKKFPRLAASRLYNMVKDRGYPGRPSHFRHIVSLYRPPRLVEAYLRLKTLRGEQSQVDWAHFGKLTIGKASRPLMAFVMVLSWSRAIFLRFFLGQDLWNFLRGHEEAFSAFSGVSRVILYDNLKSAVLERVGDAIHFHPVLLQFSSHYCFEPRPVAIARGNEKGRVERAIRFIRSSFFAARKWKDLADLNRQADEWCLREAMDRRWPQDTRLSVREAFEQEKDSLLALPQDPFPTEERIEVSVRKSPYVRFDRNDYSVPYKLAGKTVVILADAKTVRILHENAVEASHQRSYDKAMQIEDPAHIQELVDSKRHARKHRGIDRLSHVAPASEDLLRQLAERGQNLGSAVAALLRLLDAYGAEELQEGICEALRNGVPHPHAVRHALERRRQAQGKPAAIALTLPEDPRVRDLTVKPHSLQSYDQLKEDSDHGEASSEQQPEAPSGQ